MPVGAGLGTFVPVYAMFEKPEQVSLFYVNRAHNDVLELWLETGVAGTYPDGSVRCLAGASVGADLAKSAA